MITVVQNGQTIIDNKKIPGITGGLPAPQNVKAIGYDRHVEVRWRPVSDPALDRYVIYRAGKGFTTSILPMRWYLERLPIEPSPHLRRRRDATSSILANP